MEQVLIRSKKSQLIVRLTLFFTLAVVAGGALAQQSLGDAMEQGSQSGTGVAALIYIGFLVVGFAGAGYGVYQLMTIGKSRDSNAGSGLMFLLGGAAMMGITAMIALSQGTFMQDESDSAFNELNITN